jgi:hypothetical protein
LVERNLAKVEVESSRLFSRSRFKKKDRTNVLSLQRKKEAYGFLFFVYAFCPSNGKNANLVLKALYPARQIKLTQAK